MSQLSIIRLPEVRSRTGLSRSSILAAIKAGNFPQKVSLASRAVGWIESEIDEWIEKKVQVSRLKLPTSKKSDK